MANQPNVINQLINPLHVQTYQRYLPTAFDEGMTLLEKVNKIIIHLNQIGKLSNDVLDQWNQVMDWVMSDGLDASVVAKIDSMLADGTLATILGNAISDLNAQLATMNSTITKNKSDMEAEIAANKATVEGEMSTFQTSVNNQIAGFTTKFYYGTPEDYGAKGDGTTDDSAALQQCFNQCLVTVLSGKAYLTTKGLQLPRNHSIQGNHSKIIVGGNWTNPAAGSEIPDNTLLAIQPRQPVWQSEYDASTAFVKDLRLIGNSNVSLTAMFLGNKDKTIISQGSTINYSVYGMDFNNIFMATFGNGVLMTEAWGCTFNGVKTQAITGAALWISGQSVNNNFIGCSFGTQGQGAFGLVMEGYTYSQGFMRPEGNNFLGGFYGEADVGIKVTSALATKFTGCVVDLNNTNAFIGYNPDDCILDACWFAANGICASLADLGTQANGTRVVFNNCNFNGSAGSLSVGANQNGVLLNGNEMTGKVQFWSGSRGSLVNNVWKDSAQLLIDATAVVYQNNNTNKYSGAGI